jgi:methionine sulfoxide reductase heme-binding subunit
MKKWNLTPLQIAVHIGAWIPLAWLVWAYNAHRLTVNPIQDTLQRTGRYALVLLVLCLACTPLNTVFGWKGVIKVRRALGLYSFLYAMIHVLILSGWDYQFHFAFLYADFSGKLYIWAGVATWLILLALAATAPRWAMKLLGKNWKRLHRLVYLAGLLVILHYAWAKKGDLFRLQGDIRQPLYYGLLVILLLALRIPSIARGIKKLRTRLSYRFSRFVPSLRHELRSWLERGRRANRAGSSAPRSP